MTSAIQFLEKVLRHAATSKDLTNFKLIPNEELVRGDGFLSEFHTGKIVDLDTGKIYHLYIKLPLDGHSEMYPHVFINELDYYAKILPELQKFEESRGVPKLLKDLIPKFYCGSIREGQKYLVLEDLKQGGFVLHDKSKFLAEDTLKILFETYGKYHAISWAFKHNYPEKYDMLLKRIVDVYPIMFKQRGFVLTLKKAWEVYYKIINATDEVKGQKIKHILEHFQESCSQFLNYKGKLSALLHGDCWSNNIMLCYDEKKIDKIIQLKLLDHQMVRDSTPVHDLSYFFYSGASKKDFEKLDDYLSIYCDSFRKRLEEFGVDTDGVLELSNFKEDWKQYALFGINMGLVLWPAKLMSKDVVESLAAAENMHDAFAIESENILHGDVFKAMATDLIEHAFDYGIL